MIKIRFSDENVFRQEFLTAAKQPILDKIGNLIIALGQSLGQNVRKGKGFGSFKGMTRKIINAVRIQPIADMLFNKQTFIATVTNYRNGAAVRNINLNGLLNLMQYLYNNGGEELESLLLCPADDLYSRSQLLLANNGLNAPSAYEIEIIKLVFDYETHNDIAKAIRNVFRTRNLMQYCPYCNQEKSMYTPGANGKVAGVHQLDHFFDKASYPLVAFSMYNLVPSDATCNVINKNTTSFNDTHYMNPYARGFDDSAVFSAKINDIDLKVIAINIIIQTNDADVRRRLIGDGVDVDDDPEQGNINIFQLKSKYNSPDILEWATDKVEAIRAVANNLQSIQGFLDKAALPDFHARYANWYKNTIGARFDEAEFHYFPHSKMYRDLHDEIYRKRGGPSDPELQETIDQRYL